MFQYAKHNHIPHVTQEARQHMTTIVIMTVEDSTTSIKKIIRIIDKDFHLNVVLDIEKVTS